MRRHGRSIPGSVRFFKNRALGLLLNAAFASVIFWSVGQVAFGGDDSIVLEEAQIFGKSPAVEDQTGEAPPERPALSTAFPWEGEEQTAFNIPEDVLNELTKPDPSHLSEETSEPETEEAQGN
jgi:hypothetical protein